MLFLFRIDLFCYVINYASCSLSAALIRETWQINSFKIWERKFSNNSGKTTSLLSFTYANSFVTSISGGKCVSMDKKRPFIKHGFCLFVSFWKGIAIIFEMFYVWNYIFNIFALISVTILLSNKIQNVFIFYLKCSAL